MLFRSGSVIIPAFALGRTQEVLYHLSQLVDEGELDPKAVFLDSPMAIQATDIYRQASAEHDEDLLELVEQLEPEAAAKIIRDALDRPLTVPRTQRELAAAEAELALLNTL